MMGIQFIIGQFSGKKTSTGISYDLSGNSIDSEGGASEINSYISTPKAINDGMILNSIPNQIAPIWPGNTLLDIVITISPNFTSEPMLETKKENVVLNETAFRFGDYNDEREINVSFDVPKELQNNGTLWGHFYIGISGENLDPFASNYNADRSFHFDWPLTQYLTQKKSRKQKNLLSKSDQNEEPVEEEPLPKTTIISHYHPNFTMSFIPDIGVSAFSSIHPAMKQYFHLKSGSTVDGTYPQGWYYPVLFVNTFWQLKSHMISLTSTVNRLPLNIKLNNMAYWKFAIISSLDDDAKQAAKASAQGAGDGSQLEMVKEVLLDTNPYLLATTVAVSIVHMIFEMLAFKSDISHYRNKKNNVGISIRSILGNVFMQAVILLYLLDNNENTSWMILLSQGMGIILELWKITTIVNVFVRPSDNIIGFKSWKYKTDYTRINEFGQGGDDLDVNPVTIKSVNSLAESDVTSTESVEKPNPITRRITRNTTPKTD
ncbi:unnamed protein product [Trifolium pratense]|uniref:Uncharacterized protein n=1 Tax=Trifolium pratense TaxID=57577 RepID=A0ACB0KK45_TRIPR|nr:unnamed protein product [Trifolium pratense]